MKKFLLIVSLFTILPVFSENSPFTSLNEYFNYLPGAVHNNWSPFQSDKDYEVTVQFRVKKNGEITEPQIINSTNSAANQSVLEAVKSGNPYLPLPDKFPGESVNTQVILQYKK